MKLKALWYCTKNKPYLQLNSCVLPTEYDRYILDKKQHYSAFGEPLEKLNGKIACVSDYEVEEVKEIYCCGCLIQTKTMCHQELLGRSRLTDEEFNEYRPNYAIHIKNLEIFDKPKKLREFEKVGSYNNPTIKCKGKERGRCNYGISPFTGKLVGCEKARLTKAPQNMCYAQDIFGNKYVVISVHPEWLAMILNGLKTIEVRRKVLKEML